MGVLGHHNLKFAFLQVCPLHALRQAWPTSIYEKHSIALEKAMSCHVCRQPKPLPKSINNFRPWPKGYQECSTACLYRLATCLVNLCLLELGLQLTSRGRLVVEYLRQVPE